MGYQLMGCLACFYCDYLFHHYHPYRILVIASTCAAIGFGLVATCALWRNAYPSESMYSASYAGSILGYILAGGGCGSLGPVTLFLASVSFPKSIPPMNPFQLLVAKNRNTKKQWLPTSFTIAQAISIVTTIGFIGLAVGPPSMGNIAELTGGLVWSFVF
jgi:hypothetical protein